MADFNELRLQFGEKVWPQLRRFLVFQFKLLADIVRDFVFAPLSVVALLIDLFQQNSGENSSFERVMELGRQLDRKVDLFEEHNDDPDPRSVDGIVDSIEEKIRRGKREEPESD